MQPCESESGWPQNGLYFEWHDIGSIKLLLLQVLLRVLQNSRPISSWRLISLNINKRFHQKCTCFPIYIHLNVNCNFLKVRNCCCKLLGFAAVRPNCKFYTPAALQRNSRCFRGVPVCLIHIIQQEILKVQMGAMQMSALLQPQINSTHS